MTSSSAPRVTFDTNVCNVIHNPNKWPTLVAPITAQKIRDGITASHIAGFVSEASLFVECLSFAEKLTYLSVAGTKNPRPLPDPQMVSMFADLASLGMELLHAPLIGAELFYDGFRWASDAVHAIDVRQKRFSDFIRKFPRHEPLKTYGVSLLANQPPVPQREAVSTGPNSFSVSLRQSWALAIKREWDGKPSGQRAMEKALRPLIGEWCDVLIVGSHLAYGSEFFCTTDTGKNAGPKSILHQGNRASLASQGICIVSPADLVTRFNL